MNKQLPMQGDVATIYNSIEALPETTLKYNIGIILNNELTDTLMAKRVFKRRILYNIQNSSDMSTLRDIHTSFLYSYSDKNGKYLFQVKADYDEYKNNKKDTRPNKEVLKEILPELAWFNNQLTPLQIDDITTFTECRYAAPDTIVNIYNLDDSQVSISELSIPLLKENLTNNLKSDVTSMELMERNTIFKHIYLGKQNPPLEVTITPVDYK